MFVARRLNFRLMWFFAWRNLLRMAVLSGLVYIAYEWMNWTFVSIPFLPVATIGTAVAFYIGFKNNSAYERLWEGRRIWGGILNQSRSFALLVLETIKTPEHDSNESIEAIQKSLIYRHLAWVNILRLQLRKPIPWMYDEKENVYHIRVVSHLRENKTFDEEVREVLKKFTSEEEYNELKVKSNIASELIRRQGKDVTGLKRTGLLDALEHSNMMELVVECYNNQGASERIKTFPFPRQYGIFSTCFVNIFIVLLPFALMKEFAPLGKTVSWLMIPFCLLISWVFYTMEQVGAASENPFENGLNDVPLTAICRNIEIDLREMLGEKELPERLQPVNHILL